MIEARIVLGRDRFRLDVDVRLTQRTTSLYGASGSGKTTLLHAISGIARPDSGRIVIDERVMFDSERGIDVPIEKRRVGIVFQDARLFPHVSVATNLHYGERIRADSGGSNTFDRVVGLLELADLLDRSPRTLSGGEAQRVSIGRALLSNPDVLLLDEPLAALDVERRRSILPLLRNVRDHTDTPILYVTHDLVESQEVATHHVILSDGRVRGEGLAADLAMAGVLPAAAEFVNVFAADPLGGSSAEGQSRLRLPGGTPVVVSAPRLTGDRRFVAIRPEDVALARRPGQELSFQNQLEGRITRHAAHRGQVLVDVDVGGCSMIAIVSAHAFAAMQLDVGTPVWCLIKSNAVRDLGRA